ncbi:MAG: Cof-type HAD-IIB family hydrolase [Clostridia bacterium]|nr:Cof-type HAD-IIB family hydrolase [Clostridia bacterium]
MYKIVMVDLDGTLLDDHKNVSKENVEMINKIHKEKNVIFVITTGKNINDITYITDIIGEGINQYIIASNGAVIKNNVKDEYIVKKYLTQEEVLTTIDTYKKYNLIGLIQTWQGPVIEDKLAAEVQNITYAENLKDYVLNNKISNIALITPMGKEENLKILKNEIENKVDTLNTTEICDFTHTNNGKTFTCKYIDVMKKGATKANAIKILIDYLKINKEEVIAIGDGGNDIPMFEIAGYKVVMGNANEYVKSKADYITDTNNNNGVAKALEYIFYKGEG